jgi:uncharacterized protein (TIGR02996 family)
MSSITHTHYRATDALARLRALDGWPADPRAALGAIENLERITFHATSTKPFWSALIAFAASHGDRRAADALAGVGKRIKSILRAKYTDLTAMQNWFAKQIAAAVAQMPPDVPLDPAATTTCERVAEQIRAVTDRGATLLAEIVAKPADDQLRQVYADHLQEQGDPRGELIALQLAGRDPERQSELIEQHTGTWLAPLAAISWVEGTVFARGFPDEVWLNDANNTDAVERSIGHPIWATVRRLHLPGFEHAPVELLRHPVMRSLEHVGAYDPAPILEILEWDRVPYRSLGLDSEFASSKPAQRAFLAGARKLTALRELGLGGVWFETPKAARWLLEAPLAKRLERVRLTDTCSSLGAWIAAVQPLAIEAFRFENPGRGNGSIELVRDRKKRLAVAHVELGDELSYGDLCWQLDTLETLSELHVAGPPPRPADQKRLAKLRARFGLK